MRPVRFTTPVAADPGAGEAGAVAGLQVCVAVPLAQDTGRLPPPPPCRVPETEPASPGREPAVAVSFIVPPVACMLLKPQLATSCSVTVTLPLKVPPFAATVIACGTVVQAVPLQALSVTSC